MLFPARRLLAAATLLAGLLGGIAPAAAADPAAADVERGRYLARIANCVACHTSEGGKPFAGGLPIRTAAGTLHSTISRRCRDGIGSYTLAEFDRAVRQGVARDAGGCIRPCLIPRTRACGPRMSPRSMPTCAPA